MFLVICKSLSVLQGAEKVQVPPEPQAGVQSGPRRADGRVSVAFIVHHFFCFFERDLSCPGDFVSPHQTYL